MPVDRQGGEGLVRSEDGLQCFASHAHRRISERPMRKSRCEAG